MEPRISEDFMVDSPRLMTKTESFVVDYPQAVEFTNKQLKIFWLPDEIKVEKDVQDILVNMTPAEKHGVITTLRLFTLYELKAGAEYWGGRFMRLFPRPELMRMASAFSMFELAVHKPFYNKINELLHLNTDEFYLSYAKDPVLADRMAFIDEIVSGDDPLMSLAGFSMVEGAVLYSSFAFLKHFQSKGKNKLNNVVRGINFSVRDENLHSMGGAWAFKQLLEEMSPGKEYMAELEDKIMAIARRLFEHEHRIVDMIFEKGDIDGVTKEEMQTFVKSRLNVCLSQLGIAPAFSVDPEEDRVSSWFYRGINNYGYNDFFAGAGKEYNRNWDESGFTW
jgi:ribonucleotide reductase beta subunit family protein with ferritin-like domain